MAQIASPFVVTAWSADNVKIGLDNPLTGTYAAVGKNELIGCQLALDQINAKGGILGRKAELLVEDSTSGDAGTAVQKARKLIDRDKVDFLLGNINSALAAAMANVSYEKSVFHVVPGGHTDPVTGTNCHWNVFRVCNTTQMEANAVAGTLIKTAGKKWYYITPDYAFGHTLQAGLEKACAALGGSKVGGDLTPLGTTDLLLLPDQGAGGEPGRRSSSCSAGDDAVNCAQAGGAVRPRQEIPPGRRAAGAGSAAGLAAGGARRHLGVRMVLEAAERAARERIRRRHPQAERRPRADRAHLVRLCLDHGPARLRRQQAKSLEAVKMAKAMQGFKLPPEVSLMPDGAFYRAGENQLIPDLYVGHAPVQGGHRSRGSLRGRRSRQRSEHRGHAGGDRLQDDVAGLIDWKCRAPQQSAAPGLPIGAEGFTTSADIHGCDPHSRSRAASAR